MERIKAFYPDGTEKIIHHGKNGNSYYLDAISIPLGIRKELKDNSAVDIVLVNNSDDSILSNSHSPELLEAYKTGNPMDLAESSGLEWNTDFYQYVVNTAWTSIRASEEALKNGKAIAITAGGHHAERNSGMGFDPIANLIVASKKLIIDKKVGRVAFLDLDVHYANGNNLLVSREPQLLYCDLWKYKLEDVTSTQNGECVYSLEVDDWESYKSKLNSTFRKIEDFDPGLLVIVNGLDVLDSDRMGGVSGFGEVELDIRSKSVGEFANKNNYPITVFTGGGYINHTKPKNEVENAKRKLTELYVKSIFSIMNCEKKTADKN